MTGAADSVLTVLAFSVISLLSLGIFGFCQGSTLGQVDTCEFSLDLIYERI